MWNCKHLTSDKLEMLPSISSHAQIILLTETWQELGGSFSLPGYACVSVAKHFQHQLARRPSGGIAAFIRNDVSPYVSQWRPLEECSHLWLHISADAGMAQDLYLCLCYLPPQNSTYYQSLAEHPLDVITREVHCASGLGVVLLAGDFNARTGCAPDWANHNDLADIYDYLEGAPAAASNDDSFRPSARHSKDPKLNSQGKALLQLCQECDVFLLNGRTPGDESGELTCTNPNQSGSSVVDYFAASPGLSHSVGRMHVMPCPCTPAGQRLSDHNPLHLTLSLTPSPPRDPSCDDTPSRVPRFAYCPSPETAILFKSLVASDVLLSCSHLDALTAEAACTTLQTQLLLHVADLHKPINTSRSPNPNGHKHQAWFDAECKAMRRRFHAARSSPNTHLAEQVRKEYRRLTAQKKKLWNEARLARLLEDARHSPASFWRAYRKKGKAAKIESAVQWFTYFKGLFSKGKPRCGTLPRLAPLPESQVAQRTTAAIGLNNPITSGEVESAVKKLRRNKACGLDGIKAEFVLDAALPLPSDCIPTAQRPNTTPPKPGPLVPILTLLFNKVFKEGFPASWNSQVIQPIYKSGDESDCNNYRGISIGPVLAKLYALVLEARLTGWAEGQGVRAKSQAGFRRGHRTTDHIYTLQTLFDKSKAKQSALYCCFVDFKKAFDLVPRDLLWQRLQETGVHGQMLEALKSLYVDVRACVATPQGLTETFECGMGVKQGCPLSPLLFGLYIDRLEQVIQESSSCAPTLHGIPVPMLLYADDLLLMDTTAAGLQCQLDALQMFCQASELNVNLAKTQILVCHGKRPRSEHGWQFGGESVSITTEYKYLGLVFHSKHGFSKSAEKLNKAAQKAMYGLYHRCQELQLEVPSMVCKLFDSLVRPVLTYGCEVWSIYPQAAALSAQAEVLHRGFMKRVAGVSTATPNDIIYGEFGRQPLHVHIKTLTGRFHQRLRAQDDSSLLGAAFKESLSLQSSGHPSWAGHYMEQQTVEPWLEDWELRRANSEHGSRLQTYSGIKPGWGQEAYLGTSGLPRQHGVALARLRMGSHWLGSQLGVYAKKAECKRLAHIPCTVCGDVTSTSANPMLLCDHCNCGWHCKCLPTPAEPPDEWYCPPCVSAGTVSPDALDAYKARLDEATCCPHCGVLEDERHALLECSIYQDLRTHYPDLFENSESLRDFLAQPNQARLAEFVYKCYRARQLVHKNKTA